ncbi:neuropeptide Y receptor type 5-like [Uloborus diversus]|uniref:neuropeptide Y receptor type 5-like n=1 Tax=Uloborus diversus TaxID=327109 RepID=UPI002409CEB2|nr:neuropeptide Y receptor type 5-like [Uloborus diversus]XP_054708590.1 neuropeptide Y receptor type 5-like [Uloborus diversus]
MALKEIPDRYLGMIIHFLMSFHNDTSEFRHPHLRKSFQSSYVFFVLMYAILMIVGFVVNIMMLRKIFSQKSHNISLYKYLALNSFNDIVKCLVILPLALSTTLIQNWVYGRLLCYLFPMLQDIPFHATMLTFLLMAFDRYRQILYPLKQHLSFFMGMIGVWMATAVAVLPYLIYTRYLNLEIYFGAQFKGTGICAINVEDNIEEYIRGLFIIMYVLPLGLIAFLHVKTSEEIKIKHTSYTVSFHDVSVVTNHDTDSVASLNPDGHNVTQVENPVPSSMSLKVPKRYATPSQSGEETYLRDKPLHFSEVGSDDNRDWQLEKQIQDFLAWAVTSYAVCLLPLNLVRLLKHVVYETYENSFHFDMTFITVVWIASLPIITTPGIFLYWHRTGEHTSNISRYLRLGRASDVSFSAYDLNQDSLTRRPPDSQSTI